MIKNQIVFSFVALLVSIQLSSNAFSMDFDLEEKLRKGEQTRPTKNQNAQTPVYGQQVNPNVGQMYPQPNNNIVKNPVKKVPVKQPQNNDN